jgi:NAD(P)-dependent dehydrogenase (short-subunit alcohol dehydrogenase family)
MDLLLQGKHVFITGGSQGIGLACAQEFAREGCSLSIVSRDADRLQEARALLDPEGAGRVRTYEANLSDPADAERVIEEAERAGGAVDVLVNAAGAARQKPFAELQPQDWRAAMDAKFFTYINVMDPMIKRMGSRGTGAVVSIIGMGGKIPISTHLPGGAANAALMLATAGLALAYGPLGVRVNALNPTKTATDRLAHGVEAEARQSNITTDEALAKAKQALPLGRLATPQDIAAAVAFLASPRAGYISGANISVDGGGRPLIV